MWLSAYIGEAGGWIEFFCAAAQDHQEPRLLLQRRGRYEPVVACPAQHHRGQGTIDARVARRDEGVRRDVWRSLHESEELQLTPQTQKFRHAPALARGGLPGKGQ